MGKREKSWDEAQVDLQHRLRQSEIHRFPLSCLFFFESFQRVGLRQISNQTKARGVQRWISTKPIGSSFYHWDVHLKSSFYDSDWRKTVWESKKKWQAGLMVTALLNELLLCLKVHTPPPTPPSWICQAHFINFSCSPIVYTPQKFWIPHYWKPLPIMNWWVTRSCCQSEQRALMCYNNWIPNWQYGGVLIVPRGNSQGTAAKKINVCKMKGEFCQIQASY